MATKTEFKSQFEVGQTVYRFSGEKVTKHEVMEAGLAFFRLSPGASVSGPKSKAINAAVADYAATPKEAVEHYIDGTQKLIDQALEQEKTLRERRRTLEQRLQNAKDTLSEL
jgi:hypothetical protein